MFNLFKKTRQQEIVTPDEPTPVVVSADITINGSVTGSIQSESDVLVEPKGYCVGSFVVRELSIHGTVVGDVKANEITIHPTGQLFFRKLSADNVVLHEGGVYAEQSDCLDEVVFEHTTKQQLNGLTPTPPPPVTHAPPVTPAAITPTPVQPVIDNDVFDTPEPELTNGEDAEVVVAEEQVKDKDKDKDKSEKKDREDMEEKKRRKKGPTFVNTY